MFNSDKNGTPQCKYKDLVVFLNVALFQYLVHLKHMMTNNNLFFNSVVSLAINRTVCFHCI